MFSLIIGTIKMDVSNGHISTVSHFRLGKNSDSIQNILLLCKSKGA